MYTTIYDAEEKMFYMRLFYKCSNIKCIYGKEGSIFSRVLKKEYGEDNKINDIEIRKQFKCPECKSSIKLYKHSCGNDKHTIILPEYFDKHICPDCFEECKIEEIK